MWKSGLPNPSSFGRLVYNRAADSLVAAMVARGDDGSPFEAIYARPAAGRDYGRLDLGGARQSFTHLTSCASTPAIVFNRMTQRFGLPGAFDWDGLGAFDLLTRARSEILSQDALRGLIGGRQGWVSSIVSFDGATGRAVAGVGVGPEPGGGAVRYALCEIDLRAPALREIAHLPNVFA